MLGQKLNPEQRDQVMKRIRDALSAAQVEECEHGSTGPGTIGQIEASLDDLVDIVRRSTAERVEPYLAQIIEDICSKCEGQLACGHCPSRRAGTCLLFSNASVIVNAIAGALEDLQDPIYWMNHLPGPVAVR